MAETINNGMIHLYLWFGKKINPINAGIPKAYSFTESNLIKNKLLEYNPDLLIIYDGWNDLTIEHEHYFDPVDYKLMDQIIRLIRQSDYVTPIVLLKLYFNQIDIMNQIYIVLS